MKTLDTAPTEAEIRQWLLSFDGKQFSFDTDHGSEFGTGEYVLEEHIETILAHWGDQILPGSPVQFISQQASLMAVADLAGVDRFGNRHLLEIKARSYKTAGPGELFQLISYALDKPTSEGDLIEAFARAVWYGRRSVAARLAGLIANWRVGNARSKKTPRDARRGEREDGVLTVMANEAAIRSGLDFAPKELRFDLGTVDGQGACASALAELLDGAWSYLVAIGATKLDRWAIFREPATKTD